MNDDVFLKMSRLVDRYVKHYKSDFTDYDVDRYKNANDGQTFVWILRPCGTYMLRMLSDIEKQYRNAYAEDAKTLCNYYTEPKNRFYLVSKGKFCKKVSRQSCLDLYKL